MGRMLLGIFAGLILGISVTAGASLVRGATSGDGGTGWVPDVEQVYNTALSNVFEAAGEGAQTTVEATELRRKSTTAAATDPAEQ